MKLLMNRIDRRLALVLPMAAVTVALGWGIASPEQRIQFGNGELAELWTLIASVLVVTLVHSLLCAASEELDTNGTYTPSLLHWITQLSNFLCHIARSLKAITAKIVALLIVAVTRVTQRLYSTRPPPSLPLLDCWPTGRSPLIVYEQLA